MVNLTPKPFIRITHTELDELVHQHIGYPKFRSILDVEIRSDDLRAYEVRKIEENIGELDELKKLFKTWEDEGSDPDKVPCWAWPLAMLVHEGHLPMQNYLVDFTW